MKIHDTKPYQHLGILVLMVASLLSHAADNSVAASHAISGNTILVTVNDQPVRRALFDALVKSRTEQSNPYDEPNAGAAKKIENASTFDQKAAFDDLLSMEILAQEAKGQGIHLRPDVIAEAELQYKTLLQQQLVAEIISKIQIEPAEIQARYQLLIPERSYKVSHILLNTEQEANSVIKELGRGAKFQAVAHKRTLDKNTKKDGFLGWMMTNQLEKSFVFAVENLTPGSYSQSPFLTQYGWHVVLLHASRDLAKPPIEIAQSWIRQEILYEKVNIKIQQIRKAAKIEAQ